MARQESCILTNMCMVYDGDRILVLDRKDPKWKGITFPGGHVEPRESFHASVIREVWEETGLHIHAPKLCGIKQWTHKNGEYRYIVLFYKTNIFSGELRASDEGDVFWIKRSDLDKYALVDGFEGMMDVFENDELSENYHWFEDGQWLQKNL